MRKFRLDVAREPGALERVLGVVRRRGFGVEELSVVARDAATWHVSIVTTAVPSEASLALRQFGALIDVRHAYLEENATSA